MNTRNVIRRIGVVFIFGPIFICLVIINMIVWLSIIIWGPFYYIITGKDPMSTEPDIFFEHFANWYFNNFGPNEY